MALCPSCGKKSLDPVLKSKPYLIVKESYTQVEHQSIPFTLTGKNKYGKEENTNSYYVMKELGMVGINMQVLSLHAFWSHTPPKGGKTKDGKAQFQKCLEWSISEVIRLSEGKKIVFLMGAEVTRTFVGHSVSDVTGLVCKSDLLPNVPVIIPCPNPDNIMKQPIGEMRFAMKTFAEQIKIYEEYSKV